MAPKTSRIEARISPDERSRIERAAAIAGMSVSAFHVQAAVTRADAVIAEATTATVPSDYFDGLLTALDEPDSAPRLALAARRAGREPRISPR